MKRITKRKALSSLAGHEMQWLWLLMSGGFGLQVRLGADPGRLIDLARIHRLTSLLGRIEKVFPGFFSPLQTAGVKASIQELALLSLKQLQELIRICKKLNAARIDYVVIKGPQLARMVYGREAIKESVDLDLVLKHEEGLPEVKELLGELGYLRSNLNKYPGWRRALFQAGKREVQFMNREAPCHIDLHLRPGANAYLTAGRFESFFTGTTTMELEGIQVPVLKDESYFVYLCYHGALHQFSRLGWMNDLLGYYRLKKDTMDWDEVWATAALWGVERCLHLTLFLFREWFSETVPETPRPINPRSRYRIYRLARACTLALKKPPRYGLTLSGRFEKWFYMMQLTPGWSGKADYLLGILIRQLLHVIEKR